MADQGRGMRVIRLRQPAENAVTAPLQKLPWPGWSVVDADRERHSGDWWSDGPEHDRSLPRAVQFAWDPPEQAGARVYELRLEAQDGSNEVFTVSGIQESQAEVKNLRIATTYHWLVAAYPAGSDAGDVTGQVMAADADPPNAAAASALAVSPVGVFHTSIAPPRWIEVPGLTNVRDLGGWPLVNGGRLRQGMVFRGSEMNAHCEITPKGVEVLAGLLGIRSDIDLRGEGEDCRPVLDPQRVAYYNLPIASYDMIASLKYIPLYRDLFALLADPETYPVYLHCWGGADRTGTVAFLLGALLGMRDEDLMLDYELTSLSIWGERRSDTEPFTEMLETLHLFASDGSPLQTQVERYLRVIGITEEEITAIRELLTEKPAG